MPEPRKCCKGCEKRSVYCHCTCEEYKAYKEELEQQKAEIEKNKESERIMSEYIRDNYKKRRWTK